MTGSPPHGDQDVEQGSESNDDRGKDPNEGRTAATVLRYEAYPVHPWRNGRGRVRHIADGEGWQLRLADITDSGPFSDYAGHLRLFAMVEGAAVLEMPDGQRIHCDPEAPVAAFDGGAAPDCSLVTGPARALNLITRTGQVLASLERRTVGDADTVAIASGPGFVAIHVQSGQVECVLGASGGSTPAPGATPVLARAGDTLLPPGGASALLRAKAATDGMDGTAGTAGAVVLVGRIQPLPGPPPMLSTPTKR